MTATTFDPVPRNPAHTPRPDGFTDDEIGVPAADFQNGISQNDTNEWPAPTADEREENESIFEEGLDSGDDTVIPLEDPVPV